jgi:hypothetical protein
MTTKATIPFRGKSYDCRLPLAALFRAEFDLNIAIISPSPQPFHERPQMVQMTAYLYAALSSVAGLNPTLPEVQALLAGPKAGYVQQQIEALMPALTAELTEYAKQFKIDGGGEGDSPLAVADGGGSSGPTP